MTAFADKTMVDGAPWITRTCVKDAECHLSADGHVRGLARAVKPHRGEKAEASCVL